jgi:hypothetical protein
MRFLGTITVFIALALATIATSAHAGNERNYNFEHGRMSADTPDFKSLSLITP